jgi:DNA-directed RNA polymerase specialized sigma24 family protein
MGISSFDPITLSSEEKSEIEAKMHKAFIAFKRASMEKYGFANIKQLRDSYKACNRAKDFFWCDPQARQMMDWVIENEQLILSGYIRIAHKLCEAFHYSGGSRPSVSYADYLQEAAMAIYDTMYMFNGKNCFTTYIYYAIKNRLISFIKHEDRLSGISDGVRKLQSQLKSIMNKDHCSLERALDIIQETEDIGEAVVEKLKMAMRHVSHQSPDIDIAEEKENEKLKDQTEGMWKSLEETNLTHLERSLVMAHLNGQKDFRRNMAETVINKHTGKLWAKARLSQIFIEACEKIRMTHEGKRQTEAA